MAIKPIDLVKFIESTKNIHEAIVVASRRARQLNDEMKIEFNQRIELVSTKVETEATEEIEVNPDQLKVSVEFEKRPKPTDTALEDVLEKHVRWRYKEPEQVLLVEEEEEEDEE